MLSQCLEPLLHSVDLVVKFALSVTLVDESLRPFSVSGGDLFDSDKGVAFVISFEGPVLSFVVFGIFGIFRLAPGSWAAFGVEVGIGIGTAVRLHVGVEKSAVVAVERRQHALRVFVEFDNPALFGREVVEVVVEPLLGELVEPVEPLVRAARRNFFLLGKNRNRQKCR